MHSTPYLHNPQVRFVDSIMAENLDPNLIGPEIQGSPASNVTPAFQRVRANQYGPSYKTLGKGSLVVAKYLNWKHDPYPLIFVSSLYGDGRLAGVNLHYLTFPFIKTLLQRYRTNQTSFSYQSIKGDKYIVNAFRTYQRNKLTQTKILNIDFLLTVLGSIRSFNPNEIEKMRKEIEKQLRQQVNPKAKDIAQFYKEQVASQKRDAYNLNKSTFARSGTIPTIPTTPGQAATIPTQPTS